MILQFEQYDFIIHQINQITKQLNDLRIQSYANNTINGDIKQIKACDIIENKDKIEYLQYEVNHFKIKNDFESCVLFFSYNDMKPMQIDCEDIFNNYNQIVRH